MNRIDVTADPAVSDLWDWPLQHEDELVRVINQPDRWEVGLDAGFFTPQEIEINRSGDKLFIHLHHDERQGELGSTTREVKRSYKLPADVDPRTVRSNLTRDGRLHITAQKKPPTSAEEEEMARWKRHIAQMQSEALQMRTKSRAPPAVGYEQEERELRQWIAESADKLQRKADQMEDEMLRSKWPQEVEQYYALHCPAPTLAIKTGDQQSDQSDLSDQQSTSSTANSYNVPGVVRRQRNKIRPHPYARHSTMKKTKNQKI